jgi:uncharacterized membrane protein YidH (DUF202 family)
MNWPALLVAPALALANLTITYAMVTPSCARQNAMPLSVVSVLILVACLAMTFVAWRNWYRSGALEGRPSDDAAASTRFVALVSAMVGTLSSLVVVAMWFPQWVLSPCYN